MIQITINTDSAALEDNLEAEVSWMLKELADKIRRYGDYDGLELRDSDGNVVGKVTTSEEGNF